MSKKEIMSRVLFLFAFLIGANEVFGVNSCDASDVAVYKVTLRMLWSEESFPKDYPLYRPKAQWSQVFGQSHNSSYELYKIGKIAQENVRDFAQFGKIDTLVEDGDDDPRIYDQFSAPAVADGVGSTENVVFVNREHSLISLICRLMPSPDWFIGVDSLNLCVDSGWVEQITLDLEPLDAGAARGFTFTAPRWESEPGELITRHLPRKPNHPAAGFYYPQKKELPPIATVSFKKVKEYSTIELNQIARKGLLDKLKIRTKVDSQSSTSDVNIHNRRASNEEISTKSPLEQLKDLEEDPIGREDQKTSDNNVVVVTQEPTSSTTTESEFGEKLQNMDDVVLAVAHGKRMGLGMHLPRHFRSRLHHAINKIKPNDCLVSSWSEWTPCSVTCGFGNQYRERAVIREKQDGGRDCPTLQDRRHCGNINSCAHIDYFEW